MNEEEKEAIRSAKCEIETEKEVGCIFAKWLSVKELEVILTYIDKLQGDVKLYKDQADYVTNEYGDTIEELQKENKHLKEHILKIKNYLK